MTISADSLDRKTSRGLGVDVPLLVIVAALVGIGLMMVYSASWDLSYSMTGSATSLFATQLRNLAIGLVAMLVFFRIDYHRWHRGAVALMGLTLVGLVAVLIAGVERFGAQRGLAGGSYQPSELAKLAVVLYLAVWLNSKSEKIHELNYGLIPFVVIVGLVSGLILRQPDLSAAVTVGVVAIAMFFLAGAEVAQMGLVSAASIAIAWFTVRYFPTGRSRWEEYVLGVQNLREASWHVQQAAIALVNGGLFGRGLGQSHQKFGFLPAPHTDSIFAIVGEELGLIGCLALVALFVLLITRGLKIAANAPDSLGRLMAAGLVVWIAFEASVNVAVMVGILPFAGNALPLISYGGSNLVVTLAAVGLLLNISRSDRSARAMRATGASHDLGRRDGWRRVSRAGRRADID